MDSSIHIQVGTIYSIVQSSNHNVLATLNVACRARPQGYQFSKKYKTHQWNGYISLVESSNKFPTGLLSHVVSAFKSKGFTVNLSGAYIDDDVDDVNVDVKCLHGIVLRDYQEDAVTKLLKSRRGIAKMATNAGKTEVMAAVIYYIPGVHIVLVHRLDLMYQTQERLSKRLREPVGICGDGKLEICRVNVVMIQSLNVAMIDEHYAHVVGLHIDECHHGSSDSYLRILDAIPAYYRYGYSGTPLLYKELNDMRLIGATGKVLVDISNDYMIEAGYSAKPTVNMHEIVTDDDNVWEMTYTLAYFEYIVTNVQRNSIIQQLAQDAEGIVLIIVRYINHGQILRDMIPGSTFISGRDDSDTRKQVLKDMSTRHYGVYVTTNIFDEGVDVPSISTIIMAAGGKAEHNVLQRIGRGLRLKKDGSGLTVHDFIDDTNKHLFKHSEERVNIYVREGFEITTT